MNNSTVKIYDTTLRDGTQGEGISFSVTDKLLIAENSTSSGWTTSRAVSLARTRATSRSSTRRRN